MKKVMPVLSLIAKKVPYGPAERSMARTHMYNMVRWSGCFTKFITVAFDDAHEVAALRLCFPSVNNTTFPATVDSGLRDADDFVDALESGRLGARVAAESGEEMLVRILAMACPPRLHPPLHGLFAHL